MHIVSAPEPMDPESTSGCGPDDSCDPSLRLEASPVTEPGYKTDVTTLTQRIALRLADDGVTHPVVAAMTIAVRGLLRLEVADYAERLSLSPAQVADLEGGEVALEDVPDSLWSLASTHELEPLVLVDLQEWLRSQRR